MADNTNQDWLQQQLASLQGADSTIADPLKAKAQQLAANPYSSDLSGLTNSFQQAFGLLNNNLGNFNTTKQQLSDWYNPLNEKLKAYSNTKAAPVAQALQGKLQSMYDEKSRALQNQYVDQYRNMLNTINDKNFGMPKPATPTAAQLNTPLTANGALPSTLFSAPAQQAAPVAQPAQQPQQPQANTSFSNFVKQYNIPKPQSMAQAQQVKALWQRAYGGQ